MKFRSDFPWPYYEVNPHEEQTSNICRLNQFIIGWHLRRAVFTCATDFPKNWWYDLHVNSSEFLKISVIVSEILYLKSQLLTVARQKPFPPRRRGFASGQHVGFVVDKRHRGRFSPSTSVSPANNYTNFSIIIITWGWHNRPLVAAVPSGTSWTQPPTMPIKKIN
jgi:hypothetical protein